MNKKPGDVFVDHTVSTFKEALIKQQSTIGAAILSKQVKVKVNVDLYSVVNAPLRRSGMALRHPFSRDFTVLPAHRAFIR